MLKRSQKHKKETDMTEMQIGKLGIKTATQSMGLQEFERRTTMKVCERCLWAIESREGNLKSEKHWIEDGETVLCEWCEMEIESDSYYEI
jgi:hypothetical protein